MTLYTNKGGRAEYWYYTLTQKEEKKNIDDAYLLIKEEYWSYKHLHKKKNIDIMYLQRRILTLCTYKEEYWHYVRTEKEEYWHYVRTEKYWHYVLTKKKKVKNIDNVL